MRYEHAVFAKWVEKVRTRGFIAARIVLDDPNDAEDVVQDRLEYFFRRGLVRSAEEPSPAYFAEACMNAARRMAKRETRRSETLRFRISDLLRVPAVGLGGGSEWQELATAIRDCHAKLPDHLKLAYPSHEPDMALSDICKDTGLTKSAVKNRRRKARALMEDCVTAKVYGFVTDAQMRESSRRPEPDPNRVANPPRRRGGES